MKLGTERVEPVHGLEVEVVELDQIGIVSLEAELVDLGVKFVPFHLLVVLLAGLLGLDGEANILVELDHILLFPLHS